MLAALHAMTTPFTQTAFAQLIDVLNTLKDEQAAEHSSAIGKTLEWDEETGNVRITVRSWPYLCVNVTVKTSPLWREYMDSRGENRDNQELIPNRFYFDDSEDVCEVRVHNVHQMMCAAREMLHLNRIRLDWPKQKTDRHTALAMGTHPRLGADSPLAVLDANVMQIIAQML
jgi:hypothetical protein